MTNINQFITITQLLFLRYLVHHHLDQETDQYDHQYRQYDTHSLH